AKTADTAAVALSLLLTEAPPLSKSYLVAADQAQARLALDSIEGYLRRSPRLAEHARLDLWKLTVKASGATLEALPADAPGSWGLRPWLAVCDELAQWGETGTPVKVWEAIGSAMGK